MQIKKKSTDQTVLTFKKKEKSLREGRLNKNANFTFKQMVDVVLNEE